MKTLPPFYRSQAGIAMVLPNGWTVTLALGRDKFPLAFQPLDESDTLSGWAMSPNMVDTYPSAPIALTNSDILPFLNHVALFPSDEQQD